MADVYEYKVLSGTIVPNTDEIKTEVEQEFKTAFGNDLIITPDNPQGLLITGEVLARTAVADNNAVVANQFNPNLSGGIFLDAIMALTGSRRTPAVKTKVSCTLTGVAGTIIPQGVQVKDSANGKIFQSLATVTLAPGAPGTATVDFEALEDGAITVAIGTMTQILSSVLGWETCTNSAIQSVLGSETQSDVAAKLFRRNTLALQGQGLALAILSGLYALPGVVSASFRENVTDGTLVIDGVTMVGHSMYTCVDGGSNIDIANLLTAKKNGGCAYNNGGSSDPQDVPVVVPISGQTIHVLFDRPDIIEIRVRATVKSDTSIQDPVTVVKKAILDYVNGLLEGEAGLTVGTSVSCFELAGAVNREAPGIYVQNMETSLLTPIVYSNSEKVITIYEKAVITDSLITVVLV